jgi:predicted permease
MSHLQQDLRFAIRRFTRDKAFTILAALALGLGVGVNTTFFSLVNAAVLRGLQIDAAEEVMFVSLRDAGNAPRGLSFAEYDELRSDTRAFAAVGAYATAPMTLVDEDAPPDRVLVTSLSASGFRVLGVAPLLGRDVRPEDDRPGAPTVVLIAERVWRARYGGRASIVGRDITLNGAMATVIGVMPEHFRFPSATDVWQPLAALTALQSSPREARMVSVFGRLTPGWNVGQAQSEFDTMRLRWAAQNPALYDGLRASVVPIQQQFFGRVSDTVWLAFITSGLLVLIIACANVANLLLMRATARGREIAIRQSLGASHAHIVRQLLLESALLAALGTVAGLVFCVAGLRLLQAQVPADVATLFDFSVDRRVAGALIAASVASIFVFGLTPALHLAHGSAAEALKDGGRGSGGTARRRLATAFLAAEFALTLVLLANVAEGIRIAGAAQEAQFPIDPTPLLTMTITLPSQPYATPEARHAFFVRLQEAVAGHPSVAAVTLTSALPGTGTPLLPVTIAGQTGQSDTSARRAGTVLVGERYFETVGAPLLRGRTFGADDGRTGQETAIVNERFAELFLPGEEPIGTLIRVERPGGAQAEAWLRIVGVAPSVRHSAVDGIQPDPIVYLPAQSAPPVTTTIVVRATGDPASLASPVRTAVQQLDPSLPLYRVMTMTDAMRQAQWNGRIARVLLHAIGTIALLLALVGLYAVTAHSVRLRRRELGIRMALGAPRSRVAALVLRRAMLQVAIGIAAGAGATVAFDRLFNSPATQLIAAAVMLPTIAALVLVAAAACLWPAARATRWDPALVLRDE